MEQARRTLADIVRDGGKTGQDDTVFHKEIIKQLCSNETPVKVILTGYFLSRYESSRLGGNDN